MDNATDLIVDYSLVQVTETGSSVTMETEGFQRCLTGLLAKNVEVLSIATDRHRSVGALMKKKFPHIVHQFDVWHVSKSITKKLTAAGKAKHCEKLLPWVQSISNHLWWCARTCNKNEELLYSKWTSVIHHVCNVHEWEDGKCSHDTLNEDERRAILWIKPNSPSHNALRKVGHFAAGYKKAFMVPTYWILGNLPFSNNQVLS